jgi:hypothetical protein
MLSMKSTLASLTTAVVLTIPGWTPAAEPPHKDSMENYLFVLNSVSPTLHIAAQRYLHAYADKCQRQLSLPELKQAFFSTPRDPIVTQMIEAVKEIDTVKMRELGASIPCH